MTVQIGSTTYVFDDDRTPVKQQPVRCLEAELLPSVDDCFRVDMQALLQDGGLRADKRVPALEAYFRRREMAK